MFYVYERDEGNLAVLIDDNKVSVTVLKDKLNGKIGDVFIKNSNGEYIFNPDETQNRKQSIISKHRSLFNKSK